jgi:hypothetical protein
MGSPLGKWASQAKKYIHPALNSAGFGPVGSPNGWDALTQGSVAGEKNNGTHFNIDGIITGFFHVMGWCLWLHVMVYHLVGLFTRK